MNDRILAAETEGTETVSLKFNRADSYLRTQGARAHNRAASGQEITTKRRARLLNAWGQHVRR